MAKGYWVVHITVTKPDSYPDYVAVATPAIAKYGGNFLIRGGPAQLREGEARERHVVVEFESYERAIECYESDDYAPALALRQQYALSDFVIADGGE